MNKVLFSERVESAEFAQIITSNGHILLIIRFEHFNQIPNKINNLLDSEEIFIFESLVILFPELLRVNWPPFQRLRLNLLLVFFKGSNFTLILR